MTQVDELRRVHDLRVVRMNYAIPGEPDSIAIALESDDGAWFFEIKDAVAYTLIRHMTDTLFDIDPPRSGVGSPEASASA